MKKSLLSIVVIIGVLFLMNSCSKDSPSGGAGGQVSWSCEVNGKSYSWSGTYPNTKSASSFISIEDGVLGLSAESKSGTASIPFIFAVSFNSEPTKGSYTFSSSNSNTSYACILTLDEYSVASTSSGPGSNMIINITSDIPSNSYMNTNGTNPGYVNGTFNGKIYGVDVSNPGTFKRYDITNGKFNALRLD
jgi:hypothetical protein